MLALLLLMHAPLPSLLVIAITRKRTCTSFARSALPLRLLLALQLLMLFAYCRCLYRRYSHCCSLRCLPHSRDCCTTAAGAAAITTRILLATMYLQLCCNHCLRFCSCTAFSALQAHCLYNATATMLTSASITAVVATHSRSCATAA